MDIVTPAGAAAAGLRPSFRRVAALAAAFWSAGFALVHLYWLLGGRAGLPGGLSVLDNTPLLVTDVVTTPLAALALVRPWGRRLPARGLLRAARGTAVVLIVHAAPSVPDWAAPAAEGHRPVAEPAATARFATLLYEPFFLAGGVLFGCTVFGRRLLPGDDGRR
ncbi:DUF3995 domain-containing protein [Kitasatospora sp. CB02891]|uniref:DUF3995 domain-containing protein n=1 Tax=Kitasatospora sp. CB02891 TaxID=2020329 RepID=UPI000C27C59E|nr:DUF3995 domain-containing protein [Kitasatospora sp. CB02891]PJN22337.1 hypothetical protein CG736_27820 [Kitasatospora sp. CB02891]